MASLVERLRIRSERRPIYNIDDSDDENDFVKRNSGSGSSHDKIEKIERPDAVVFAFLPLPYVYSLSPFSDLCYLVRNLSAVHLSLCVFVSVC